MDSSFGYKNLSNSRIGIGKPLPYQRNAGLDTSSRSYYPTKIINHTPYHITESFGVPTPVQVTEALTFAERTTSCNVRIFGSWACFVMNRRLLIWQINVIDASYNCTFGCRELSLPPTDLSYSANMVTIFTSYGNQTVSCMAVSPEGLIRYWPNIANEGISVEHNTDLQGQECEYVERIGALGFIIATTTATILLIELNNTTGRHIISSKILNTSTGWLGGISRKVTSIFFGGIGATASDTRLVKVLAAQDRSDGLSDRCNINDWRIYVLAGTLLQTWNVPVKQPERLLYQYDLDGMITNNFLQTAWNTANTEDIEISLLDAQFFQKLSDITILVAAVNHSLSGQLHYALVTLDVEEESPPTRISSFNLLKTAEFSNFQRGQNLNEIRFLISNNSAYLYNNRCIISIPVTNNQEDCDIIEIPDTSYLGASLVGQVPIFFSRAHGFIAVVRSDLVDTDYRKSLSFIDTFTISSDTPCQVSQAYVERLTAEADPSARLKAAFFEYVGQNEGKCRLIVRETFPVSGVDLIDSDLDTVVIKVSLDIIDDIPARDPRWADYKDRDGRHNVNSTTSLQILSQLEEKRQAFITFIGFLKESGLWERLGRVTWNKAVMATTFVLAELLEKLIAAYTLRSLQSKFGSIIEGVVKNVISKKGIPIMGALTDQDIFYRKVSIIDEAIIELNTWCEKYIENETNLSKSLTVLICINSILVDIYANIVQFRKDKGALFTPYRNDMSSFGSEMILWTAKPGNGNIRNSLINQINLSTKWGLKSSSDAIMKHDILQQSIKLIINVLEGSKTHLESVAEKDKYEILLKQYEMERYSLIQLIVNEGEYGEAISLAEKYGDFGILIESCDSINDDERLSSYIEKYEKEGFAKFLFGWYTREKKKQSKLLRKFGHNKRYERALKKFLTEYPSIAWIQACFAGDSEYAAQMILGIGFEETELMKRKKVLLSIGKSLLIESGTNNIIMERINKELALLCHQEDLPELVLSAFGYDIKSMKVLLPSEIIRLYICDENTEVTEFDFKKALDLLYFVDDEIEREDLRFDIWCKAILKDDWPPIHPGDCDDDVVQYLQQFMFFKILQATIQLGNDVKCLLPPLEKLLDIELLKDLKENNTFVYLMRLGYDYYIQQSCN